MENLMNVRKIWVSSLLMLVVAGALGTRPAAAEWFFDIYGGAAFTEDTDIRLRGGTSLDDRVEFETVGTGGGRLGYWFDIVGLPWLGVALDVSYFAPKANRSAIDARLEVLPISGLLFLRLPLLASPAFPNGQVQPYIGGGPSLFVADVKIDSPITGEQRSDAQTEVGGDVRGGITFMLTPHVGIFAEGRYTFFRTNPGGLNTEFDVETFHALGGLTIRW
jgi:opacity protein-like surface antigen